VLTMLTKTPARIIGVDGYKGQLKEGYDADILLLDRDLNVAESFVRGQRQA
ncbi:MAG: amidohydrolase family protein, partial [Clostridiales bacterium]|nr:amidohydrolase family protein [Clostridiales bacterium]